MGTEKRATIIAVANLKGGVSKSATTQSVCGILNRKGYKCLAVDADAQGNLTENCGVNSDGLCSLFDIMCGNGTFKESVLHLEDSFDLIPNDMSAILADRKLQQTGRDMILKTAIKDVVDDYDFIIIDCSPSLGIITVNSLMCADYVLIPICGVNSCRGAEFLYQEIEEDRKYGNPSLKVAGFLLSMYNPRARVSVAIKDKAEQLAEKTDSKVFRTFIRRSTKVEEANFFGTDIGSYAPDNNVSADYTRFVDELLEDLKHE